MSSYIVQAKRIQQAQQVSSASSSSESRFQGSVAEIQSLINIQDEWIGDTEVDPQDLNTLNAIFVTYKPQVENLLAKIEEGINRANASR